MILLFVEGSCVKMFFLLALIFSCYGLEKIVGSHDTVGNVDESYFWPSWIEINKRIWYGTRLQFKPYNYFRKRFGGWFWWFHEKEESIVWTTVKMHIGSSNILMKRRIVGGWLEIVQEKGEPCFARLDKQCCKEYLEEFKDFQGLLGIMILQFISISWYYHVSKSHAYQQQTFTQYAHMIEPMLYELFSLVTLQ